MNLALLHTQSKNRLSIETLSIDIANIDIANIDLIEFDLHTRTITAGNIERSEMHNAAHSTRARAFNQ